MCPASHFSGAPRSWCRTWPPRAHWSGSPARWPGRLGPDGITVNALAPGAFPTAAEAIHPDLESYDAFILEQQAIKRRGTPADIANAALFLAAPETSFITGQLLVVDGGWVMN